tara:strand:+ start:25 stop:156 length:132 start_codon:yes stop_codon:yes gene_type:complete
MLTNTFLDKVLEKARSYLMKGEDTEAKKVYQKTLQDFSSQKKN